MYFTATRTCQVGRCDKGQWYYHIVTYVPVCLVEPSDLCGLGSTEHYNCPVGVRFDAMAYLGEGHWAMATL